MLLFLEDEAMVYVLEGPMSLEILGFMEDENREANVTFKYVTFGLRQQ